MKFIKFIKTAFLVILLSIAMVLCASILGCTSEDYIYVSSLTNADTFSFLLEHHRYYLDPNFHYAFRCKLSIDSLFQEISKYDYELIKSENRILIFKSSSLGKSYFVIEFIQKENNQFRYFLTNSRGTILFQNETDTWGVNILLPTYSFKINATNPELGEKIETLLSFEELESFYKKVDEYIEIDATNKFMVYSYETSIRQPDLFIITHSTDGNKNYITIEASENDVVNT
ncbi:MAG: hypothetical protein LBE09_08790, partial [Christensenellaceae bacterium]|nr:hypothetical protein [Christensenellaceae bacterium]